MLRLISSILCCVLIGCGKPPSKTTINEESESPGWTHDAVITDDQSRVVLIDGGVFPSTDTAWVLETQKDGQVVWQRIQRTSAALTATDHGWLSNPVVHTVERDTTVITDADGRVVWYAGFDTWLALVRSESGDPLLKEIGVGQEDAGGEPWMHNPTVTIQSPPLSGE